jgi:hypothetical protein
MRKSALQRCWCGELTLDRPVIWLRGWCLFPPECALCAGTWPIPLHIAPLSWVVQAIWRGFWTWDGRWPPGEAVAEDDALACNLEHLH